MYLNNDVITTFREKINTQKKTLNYIKTKEFFFALQIDCSIYL
jgi:hypothetical protein